MVSSLLLTIGFLILVLGVSLMRDVSALRRSGGSSSNKGILGEGLLLIIIGLVVAIVSIFPQLPSPGPGVLRGAGVSLIGLGFASLILLTVQTGRASVNDLRRGAWVTSLIGFALIVVAYPIVLLVFNL